MRLGRILLIVLLVAFVLAAFTWFSEPEAEVIAVDTAQVGEVEGASPIAHGLDLEPRDLVAARALWDQGELEAARSRLEAALPGAEYEGHLHVLLSVVCRRLGDADGAMEHGLDGVQLLSTIGQAHHVYARAIGLRMLKGGKLAAMRNLKPWREELRTSIDLDPTNMEARTEEFFFYAYLPGFLGGDAERALVLAEEARALDEPVGLSMKARALQQLDREDEAMTLLTSSLEGHPGNSTLLLALGNVHEAAEDWPAADAAYARIPDPPVDPNGWRGLYQRARLRTAEDRIVGEAEIALEHLDRFLAGAPRGEMTPRPADAHRSRGAAFEQLGNVAKARAAYETALALDPEHGGARKALDALGGD